MSGDKWFQNATLKVLDTGNQIVASKVAVTYWTAYTLTAHNIYYRLLSRCNLDHKIQADIADNIVKLSELLLAVDGVFDGEVYGWGLGIELDAFQDGSINPANTKYVEASYTALSSILEAMAVLDTAGELSIDQKQRIASILDKTESILNSWDQAYRNTATGGYYWFSEHPHDNKIVVNSITGMGYAWLKLYQLTGKKKAQQRAYELAQYFLSVIENDPLDKDALLWPYAVDLNHRMQNVLNAATDIKFLIELINAKSLDYSLAKPIAVSLTKCSVVEKIEKGCYLDGITTLQRKGDYIITDTLSRMLGLTFNKQLASNFCSQINKQRQLIEKKLSTDVDLLFTFMAYGNYLLSPHVKDIENSGCDNL